MPCANGADRGYASHPESMIKILEHPNRAVLARQHHLTRKRADFPLVSARVDRQPTGVGCDADVSARSQGPSLVLWPPPTVISVAGSAVVTPRLSPRPMGQPRA
jgi:hypothetical protein